NAGKGRHYPNRRQARNLRAFGSGSEPGRQSAQRRDPGSREPGPEMAWTRTRASRSQGDFQPDIERHPQGANPMKMTAEILLYSLQFASAFFLAAPIMMRAERQNTLSRNPAWVASQPGFLETYGKASPAPA